MWQAEPPVQPIQSQPAIYLAAKSNVQLTQNKERILGVCQPVEINAGDGIKVAIFAITDAAQYLYKYEQKDHFFGDGTKAKVTMVSPPKFGEIEYIDDVPVGYLPNQDFEGRDSFVIQVEQDGIKVKIKYFILVDYAANLKYITCPELPNGSTGSWKISLPTTPVEPSDIQSLLTFTGISGSVTVDIADLPGTAVAQTTGESITFDNTAAGNGWFIDATPADNAEFLPTSNPNQWIAKEGTEAANKMDLLSVLLHEYGHVLGIEHSADGNDYMAATLQPGVRRLPSTEELALMAQLAGQARLALDGSSSPDAPNPALPLGTLGFALLGRLRRSDYGGWTMETQSAQLLPQYQIAINPTLQNGDLTGDTSWQTNGNVQFDGAGQATLGESAGAQSRLAQGFTINPGDRTLSFTVENDLQANLAGASGSAATPGGNALYGYTGAALTGTDGLSQSDALLNIQTDGTEYTASSVHKVQNPDDTTTYYVEPPTARSSNIAWRRGISRERAAQPQLPAGTLLAGITRTGQLNGRKAVGKMSIVRTAAMAETVHEGGRRVIKIFHMQPKGGL